MSKKFSIKTIDLEKLDEEIERYKYIYMIGQKPYIFMNKETMDAVLCELNNKMKPYTLHAHVNNTTGLNLTDLRCEYCGCKIFNDHTLKFGEIEIR